MALSLGCSLNVVFVKVQRENRTENGTTCSCPSSDMYSVVMQQDCHCCTVVPGECLKWRLWFFFSSQSNLLLLISVSPSQSACWFSMMSTLSELVKVCRERKCLAEGMESSKCNIWKTCWEILRWLSGYFERTWCALKMQKNIKSFLTPLNAKFLLHVSSTQNTFKPTIIGQYFLKIKSNVQKFW